MVMCLKTEMFCFNAFLHKMQIFNQFYYSVESCHKMQAGIKMRFYDILIFSLTMNDKPSNYTTFMS